MRHPEGLVLTKSVTCSAVITTTLLTLQNNHKTRVLSPVGSCLR